MKHRIVATTSLLIVLGSSLAWATAAGSGRVTAPLVHPDGHGLDARFANLAVADPVALRTSATGAAEELSLWGARASAQPAVAEDTVVGRLGVGQSVFWPGGYVASRVVTSNLPTSAACTVTHCFSWKLQLTAAAKRLRVGLDTPARESSFTIEVTDPSGAVAGTATNNNRFNIETFIADPKPGTWTVRIVPRDAAYAAFRLRARSEAAPKPYPKKTLLLPNLQATPPYEFGFTAPANPLNGLYPPDSVNPPLDVLGYHPVSCAADEMAENGAQRCLRLTTGPRNAGAGPMDLGYVPIDHQLGLLEEGPVTQYLHWSDGSITQRPAGGFLFHKTHAHYHYQDILDYAIYRVTDRAKGTLVPAGHGTKAGFSPADQLFADWATFGQENGSFVEGASTARSVGASTFGLSVGWGDVYRWQRPGQYVEFTGNGDGLYVVRVVVDVKDHVLESNEKDNAAYAYVQITGESVRVIERGQGMSPWDPQHKVFTDR
jgi:hypothetical protein